MLRLPWQNVRLASCPRTCWRSIDSGPTSLAAVRPRHASRLSPVRRGRPGSKATTTFRSATARLFLHGHRRRRLFSSRGQDITVALGHLAPSHTGQWWSRTLIAGRIVLHREVVLLAPGAVRLVLLFRHFPDCLSQQMVGMVLYWDDAASPGMMTTMTCGIIMAGRLPGGSRDGFDLFLKTAQRLACWVPCLFFDFVHDWILRRLRWLYEYAAPMAWLHPTYLWSAYPRRAFRRRRQGCFEWPLLRFGIHAVGVAEPQPATGPIAANDETHAKGGRFVAVLRRGKWSGLGSGVCGFTKRCST